jgi:hypothetical protein
MHDLGVIPTDPEQDPWITNSVARDINESGQLTGESGAHPFVWFPEAFHGFPVQTPDALPDTQDLEPYDGWALTDGDPLRVVGEALYRHANRQYGYLWESDNPNDLTLIGPPQDFDPPWVNSYIYGINPDAETRLVLAGKADYGPLIGNFGAMGWDEFANPNARTLALPPEFDEPRAEARDASEWGDLVGWGEDPEDPNYAFLDRALYWESVTTQTPVNLHTEVEISELQESRAEAITRPAPGALPHVVGWNLTSLHALLWKRDSQGQWSVEDLNELIGTEAQNDWSLREAHDINNGTTIAGWGEFSDPWIVGWGLYGPPEDRDHRAFLLSTAKECPEDLDFDGDIDAEDLLILLENWYYCPEGMICWADIDMNGAVGTADLLQLLGEWGECDGMAGQVPQSIQDCIDKFGFGDPEALAACIEAVSGGLD